MLNFNELLRKYLEKESKPREIGTYYPSELGDCLRKVFFRYRIGKPPTEEALRVFARGNFYHEFITKVLNNSGDNKDEVSFVIVDSKTFIKIKGRVDNIFKKDGEVYIIEVKSVNNLPEEPYREHIIQLNTYLAFKKAKGILLYVDNNLNTKEFEINFDRELYEETLQRARKLHYYLTHNIIPPKEEDKCKFCEYRKECEDIDFLLTQEDKDKYIKTYNEKYSLDNNKK